MAARRTRQRGTELRCRGLRLLIPFVVLVTAACATVPDRADTAAYAEYEATNDPFEPLNRGFFAVNDVLDKFILRPAAFWYRSLTPPWAQDGVSNFLSNLRAPVVLANDLLQGEMERAATTVVRFMINTVGGVGGLYDLASDLGLQKHKEDFGQTLAVWGVPEGPFLFLPLIGPSNPRDLTGMLVDAFVFDPVGWWVRANSDDRQTIGYLLMGLRGLDQRAQVYDELEDIRRTSLDPYASIRSLYRQFRRSEINQGRPLPPSLEGPSLDDIDLAPE